MRAGFSASMRADRPGAPWASVPARREIARRSATRPPLSYRGRDGTKVGPRECAQVVEFTEFEPARAFGVSVTKGPESHARTFQPDGSGSRAHLEDDMKAPPCLGTLFKWIARVSSAATTRTCAASSSTLHRAITMCNQ
jgi:hypothetical protein